MRETTDVFSCGSTSVTKGCFCYGFHVLVIPIFSYNLLPLLRKVCRF